jgi:starch synthase (maltosyl-transferring)
MNQLSGQNRTVVRDVYPTIDEGRYAIKRVVGEEVNVWADVFADGHDSVMAAVQFKHQSERRWKEVPATSIGEDRWHAKFTVDKLGEYSYRVLGWVDYALYWQYGLAKKADAGVNVSVELQEGLEYIQYLKTQCNKSEEKWLTKVNDAFVDETRRNEAIQQARSDKMSALLAKYPYRPFISTSTAYRITVEREKAVFSTWYEFFPRSSSTKKGKHGTFKDCIELLPRVAEFGFDTLYFPPVHPIGYINRKGKNNNTTALEGDVGSCWGIGSLEGGHTDIHPDLGTLADFKKLIKEAEKLGIEIAMDYALQATPDHPWVKQHPDWFKQRPDGSIQYAENPPKKYQDIYPIYFETADWKNMWGEFRAILLFWIKQGIRVFRVDNPHTKPYGFWEWVIAEVRKQHPDIVFLSEAFSRPKVMHELAKAGFSQSYTYFTWRNTKQELMEYMNQLTQGPMSESFRPNFWPNTPDILPYALQNQTEHIYLIRYFLAATLSSNCGVYGPVYELMQNAALPGKEEYKDSEKFQVSQWNWDERNAITHLYTVVNNARKTYKALQRTNNITFCDIANDQLLAYLKKGTDGSTILCVVNLDGQYPQAGQLRLHPDQLDKQYHEAINLKDLITGKTYTWHGDSHFVQLYPTNPIHLFVIE